MNPMVSIISLVLIIAVFYFFMIRPQNQQQKKMQQMRDDLKPGDEVVTIGGFYGIVYAIDDKNVVLEMLPDYHKAMVVKNAISRVIDEADSVLEAEENIDENEVDALDDYVDDDSVLNDDDNIVIYETVDENTPDDSAEQASQPEEEESKDETH